MGTSTGIAWTDATWNPVRGCTRVSEGCRNCYAEKIAARFSGHGQPYAGLATRSPHRWTGKVALVPEKLDEPLRWRKPRRVFVNSMSDLFHEGLSFEDIDQVFAVMALCGSHTFQVLTKRLERMREYLLSRSHSAAYWNAAVPSGWSLEFQGVILARFPLPNVWLGVSVEDQQTADARIPILLDTPAAVRFVSYEPALGPVDFRRWLGGSLDPTLPPAVIADRWGKLGLAWVIVGGESGPKARPCDIAWARGVRDQCRAAGVAFFMKQCGARPVFSEEASALGRALRDGGYKLRSRSGDDPSEWPEDLRVREFPS